MAAAAGVAGMALIGVGAGASFTDSVSANQHIDTGTLVLNISSPDGTASNNGHTISWSLANSGSNVDQSHTVTVTNAGSLPLTLTTASFTDPGHGTQLAQDLQANFDGNTGTLASIEAPPYQCFGAVCTLAPGGTYEFPLNYTNPNLGNGDENQIVEPSLTINAVEANPSHHNAPTAGSSNGFAPQKG
jgi:predicted ribosomally synthesized peptide with SipW-like signal peptide